MENERNTVSLPLDIIIEILSRLPVKFILRSRCVCKLWRSTILSPSFIQLHHTRSLTRPDGNGLLLGSRVESDGSLHLCFVGSAQNVNQLYDSTPRPFFSASESINGLICLGLPDDDVCVCNPSTKEFVALPRTLMRQLSPLHWYHSYAFLGFDPPTNTYKILRTWWTRAVSLAHEIFTLGSQTWRVLNDDNPRHSIPLGDVVYVNGTLYWKGYESRDIVAFDVGVEKFRILELPEDAPRKFMTDTNLTQIGGRLALVGHASLLFRIELEIWISEEGRGWIKKTIECPRYWNRPIAYNRIMRQTWVDHIIDVRTTPTGELALIHRMEDYLFVLYWDLENKTMRKETIQWPPPVTGFCHLAYVAGHVESLQSVRQLMA
ncbi:F-box protein At5g65850-like [Vitis riparia]|uniref:F-box protein At5g65850-like n=1 Tax=Vitis riparia TaxID=96939 RepID=UPI00155A05F0|nr:F-box protein At5g65850-like [Vitis riparia]